MTESHPIEGPDLTIAEGGSGTRTRMTNRAVPDGWNQVGAGFIDRGCRSRLREILPTATSPEGFAIDSWIVWCSVSAAQVE